MWLRRLEVEIGQTFGRWTVIGLLPPKNQKSMCLCQCSCEKHTIRPVLISNLVSGKSKSCGCLCSEVTISRNKNNSISTKFIEKDTYYLGVTAKGEQFIFDKDDFDIVSKYTWYKNKSGYVETSLTRNNHLLLHRLVMKDIQNGFVVDHINRNKCDNRKCNLRICSGSENILNAKLNINNSSGYKGVSWNKHCNKWEAFITINYKHIYLGRYDDLQDAIDARREYELQHKLVC